MKKFVCIVIMVCMLSALVAASPISFGIGNISRHVESIYDGLPEETVFDPASYKFGSEVRLQLFFAEFAMYGVFGPYNEYFDGMLTLGVHAPLFGCIDIGLGMGPYYLMAIDEGEVYHFRHYINVEYPNSWYYTLVESFGDVINDSIMGYRLHVDVLLGKLSLGCSLEAPTMGYTISSNNPEDLDMNLEKSRIGLSAMYWFF